MVKAASDHLGLYGVWKKGDDLDESLPQIKTALTKHPSLFVVKKPVVKRRKKQEDTVPDKE